MDAYPDDYVRRNVPLIVLSGLGRAKADDLHPLQHNGFRVSSDFPSITDPRAEALLKTFMEISAREKDDQSFRWKIKTCSREYWLPCRKSSPQPSFVATPPLNQSGVTSPSSSLHSPLSPLSPGSPLYPDGLMTPSWLVKHREVVPAAYVSFFNLGNDHATDTLSDNQLKTEINNVKSRLDSSNYRIHFATVLLGEKSVAEAPEMEERLSNIKKAAKLDAKSSFFYSSIRASDEELKVFAASVLSGMRPPCMNHYSDLTKHARRKRDRGVAPPTTPTGDIHRPLSSQGWRLRYEFKLGVFAEFRDELEVAQRHFVSALDMLLNSDGMLASTSNWSPRWNEGRLFADITAIRLLQCYLVSSMPTFAVRTWRGHRERVRALVDGHGKGSSNYGWFAWEANWCKVMAGLLNDSSITHDLRAKKSIYATPEKLPQGVDRIHPWENLHHPGYWLKLASKVTVMRRQAAHDMPEDDRVPTGQSPATQVARRTELYDTYICPEPHEEYPISGDGGYDHSKDIASSLIAAAKEFTGNGQSRMTELVQHLRVPYTDKAFDTLRTAWRENLWRGSNWNGLLCNVTAALHSIAVNRGDVKVQLATMWELMNADFSAVSNISYDFMTAIENASKKDEEGFLTVISLRESDVKSFVHVYFAFEHAEGHAGEQVPAEIVLFSNAHPHTAPIALSSLTIEFEGDIAAIDITNDLSASRSHTGSVDEPKCYQVDLKYVSDESGTNFRGRANLTLEPGSFKILQIQLLVRETGINSATTAKSTIKTQSIDFHVLSDLANDKTSHRPWQKIRKVSSKHRTTTQAARVTILPKPPKLEIGIMNLRSVYYTNELIKLDIESLNKESEEASAILDVQVLGDSQAAVLMDWANGEDLNPGHPPNTSLNRSLGRLAVNETSINSLMLQLPPVPADLGIDVRVMYRLLSDLNTPVSKTSLADITVIKPFEASFEIRPSVHEAPWPSFFGTEELSVPEDDQNSEAVRESSRAHGIITSWYLDTSIVSFAKEPLKISKIEFRVHRILGDATCHVVKGPIFDEAITIEPRDRKSTTFRFDVTKLELEERRVTGIDGILEITWCRIDGNAEKQFVATLNVPRLSFPTGEPRVLASKTGVTAGMIQVDYTLENPSMHFLTFNLTMELSDDFAFSGPKLTDIHLVPMSRHTVQYALLPLVRGAHIQPKLKVVDAYFNKSLQIQPADGVTTDEDGNILIWVDEEED